MLLLIAAFVASGVTAAWGTGRLMARAVRRGILDLPNHRSSHKTPTPRGGGLAIVVVVLVAILASTAAGFVPLGLGMALAVGGALVAYIGWLDDHAPQPARLRLAVHVFSAVLVIAAARGIPSLVVGDDAIRVGWLGAALGLVAIVWMVNLYNFMDGIDGIAGVQALVAGIAASLLSWRAGQTGFAIIAASIAGASAGFLRWNWSPARIFLGDVGSGFLGFVFGCLALTSERVAGEATAVPALVWFSLLGVFIGDATLTLFRRALRRERLAEAHRSHAYQRLTQSGWSHGRASLAVGGVAAALALLAAVGFAYRRFLPAVVAGCALVVLAAYLEVERRRPMRAENHH